MDAMSCSHTPNQTDEVTLASRRPVLSTTEFRGMVEINNDRPIMDSWWRYACNLTERGAKTRLWRELPFKTLEYKVELEHS